MKLLDNLKFNKKRLLVFLVDTIFVMLAYVLAFLLRFDFHIPSHEIATFQIGFAVIIMVKPLVFLTSSLYKNLWRYASLPDAIDILRTVTVASVMAGFGLLFVRNFEQFPRAIFILDWGILFSMMAASRLVWRKYRETYLVPRRKADRRKTSRTFIVGAGDAGNLLLKEIRKQPDPPYNVIGFIDDDVRKHGMCLSGMPVLGATGSLNELIAKHFAEKVIIAMPSADKKKIRSIIRNCERARVRFKILPGISELIQGNFSVSHIKDVEIEDLLGREPVMLDEAGIRHYLTGKRILVTGAAGSIGSEICRQIARFDPYMIVLFDSAETPLFYVEKELAAAFPELRIIPILGNVRHRERVETVFAEFMPEVVFHAAAYKHVPMIEYNPVEAVSNNVGGTKVLADAAVRFDVANFVMVSTDKAVNPTNVMGASKRVAEIYVQALAGMSTTKFTTVRFGNVLGSNGSVIPLFKEQIRNGGPVTVTDPRVVRYFMTIPEASQLVLQAGCLGDEGEIFVLDMGEPVRIADLAEELIRLSGFTPHEDIEIVYTGLRPGEKLFEELLISGEDVKPTGHEKIKVLQSVKTDFSSISAQLDELFLRGEASDLVGVMQSLRLLVPEFKPAFHFKGNPPHAFQKVRHDLYPVRKAN